MENPTSEWEEDKVKLQQYMEWDIYKQGYWKKNILPYFPFKNRIS